MLLTTRVFFFLVAILYTVAVVDIIASDITALEIPAIVRNGTGPIDLSCTYHVRDDENGLVIKWYHRSDQIYQWIPPMPPQDVGIIMGLAEYPEENLREPNSRSIIRLREVTLEMSGEYVCAISTFQEEAAKRGRMIVYVPDTNLSVHTSTLNETHLNVTCVEDGAIPLPTLRFYVEGVEVKGIPDSIATVNSENEDHSVRSYAAVKNTFEPMLIDCEMSIPDTDYKKRERTVYYPTEPSSQRSAAGSADIAILLTIMLFLVL